MSSISSLLNKKTPLPPINNFLSNFPLINISNIEKKENNEEISEINNKSLPYSLTDDLSIFNVIIKYYGNGFHGKIPWSFWQTYKRVTGSRRSNSSLYHHWNGAMRKKYESFIISGRLYECISWLEASILTENHNINEEIPHTGTPLLHNLSQPSVPLNIKTDIS